MRNPDIFKVTISNVKGIRFTVTKSKDGLCNCGMFEKGQNRINGDAVQCRHYEGWMSGLRMMQLGLK